MRWHLPLARRFPHINVWGGCCDTDGRHIGQITRQVSADECVRASSDPNEFLRMIGKGPAEDISGAPNERRATDRALAGAGRK